MKTYTYEEALSESTKYFGNDLSARAFVDKYALRNENNELLELTPADMHRRIAKELARIEKKKFASPLSEEEIFSFLDINAIQEIFMELNDISIIEMIKNVL